MPLSTVTFSAGQSDADPRDQANVLYQVFLMTQRRKFALFLSHTARERMGSLVSPATGRAMSSAK